MDHAPLHVTPAARGHPSADDVWREPTARLCLAVSGKNSAAMLWESGRNWWRSYVGRGLEPGLAEQVAL
jgi:hypothetical protein